MRRMTLLAIVLVGLTAACKDCPTAPPDFSNVQTPCAPSAAKVWNEAHTFFICTPRPV